MLDGILHFLFPFRGSGDCCFPERPSRAGVSDRPHKRTPLSALAAFECLLSHRFSSSTFIGFSRFRMPPLTQILEQSRWNVHSQPLAKERLLEPPRTWLGTRAPTTQALCRPRPRSAARPLPWGRTRRRRIGQGSLTRRTRLGAASRRAEVQREPMCGPAPAAHPSSHDRWLGLGPSRTRLTATSRSGLA